MWCWGQVGSLRSWLGAGTTLKTPAGQKCETETSRVAVPQLLLRACQGRDTGYRDVVTPWQSEAWILFCFLLNNVIRN